MKKPKTIGKLNGYIGLFFVVEKSLLLHTCAFAEAEKGGDFLNYPESHDDCWQREYYHIYDVDYDYFPRGRIIYNHKTNKYTIYHDKCAVAAAESLHECYTNTNCELVNDEHYQCYTCNPNYTE